MPNSMDECVEINGGYSSYENCLHANLQNLQPVSL